MKSIQITTFGKLFLMGEHSVVYGKPGLLTSVNLPTQVVVSENKDSITLELKNFNIVEKFQLAEITEFHIFAKEQYKKYQNKNDISILKNLLPDPLSFIKLAIGEVFFFLGKKNTQGFHLSVETQLPIGGGLGSSASVSVGIVTALFQFFGKKIDLLKINAIAYEIEKYRHGKPSGADNTTVTYGGLIWFRKESELLKVIQPLDFSLTQSITDHLYLIDTGKPIESTGEMVALVSNLQNGQSEKLDSFLTQQESICRKLLVALKTENESEFMQCIQNGERNLEKIGVVSSKTINLIKQIESIGGVAKICGAGGKQENSGIVLAFCHDFSQLQKITESFEYEFLKAQLGGRNILIENL